MDVFTISGREYDSNVYVAAGRVPTVIDTGTGFFSERVIEEIQTIVPIIEIQQILLTHEHYDHVGGVNHILKETQGAARIFAHKDVVSKLRQGKSTFAEMLGGVMPRIDVDVPLTENQIMTLGDELFEVLLTPGHSIGSLCFYGKNSQVLFSGDTVFAHGGFGRYDFPGGDFKVLLHSIERLSTLTVKTLYPGHGPIVETNGSNHVAQSLYNIRSLM